MLECIDTEWISSEGPFVKRFEEGFAASTKRAHGIAVANGSAALDIAVKALGIGEGDEVIMPTFTIISPAASVVNVGAKPILVDSEADTWNMDVSQIEAKITDKTKAILVVHIYGLPVDMDPILELAKKHDLFVIEDAAEMIGQTYQGKTCGSFGDISCFSFYPNKHITTGEGGMVVTNDDALAERCRELRNLCFQKDKRRFVHEEIGWNYRLTNMQAALGLAQLEKLEASIQKKRWVGNLYNELLADLNQVELPLAKTDFADNIYWVYGLMIKDEVPFDAEEAMKKLGDMGIGCRPFFWPLHEQPVFQKKGWYQGESYPVAERMARRGFYVPSGLSLTEDQIRTVAESVKSIFK